MDITKTESGLFSVEIDGQTYEFQKWGAEESLDVLLDLAKILGKPLGSAMAAFAGGESLPIIDRDFKPEIVALIFEGLTSSLDKVLVKAIVKKVASDKVFCEGKPVKFDAHYQDRLPHLFKVVQAGLEVQYGNFYAAVLDIMPKPKKEKQGISNRASAT